MDSKSMSPKWNPQLPLWFNWIAGDFMFKTLGLIYGLILG
jgi:hypothetical protein